MRRSACSTTLATTLLALSLVVAPAGAPCAPGDEGARRPNIVMLVTDDQGYGDIGAHGNRVIRTPHLDRLHEESVRLVDFHVDPTCSPTRSALLTGRYSTRTGVWHTIMGRSLLDPEERTLAEVLRAAGYRTGMFGKWHLGESVPLRPHDQGFEEALYHGGGGVGQTPDSWGNDYFDDTYFRNGVPEPAKGYCTDVWFRNALEFIERHRQEPFFVYLATNAPHAPYRVAEAYARPYLDHGVPSAMARFYGMIANIDENVGRLLAVLDEWDLARDTVFVFLTDNGTAAGWMPRREGGEGWRGFNAGMRGTKGSEFDGGHRVPCFIRWPGGGLAGGRDIDALTAHIDLMPTLLELAGLERGDGPPLDGRSFVPLLRGGSAAEDRVLFVHSQRIPYPEKWRKCAVMTERWRLVAGRELYDIAADPGQSHDVSAAHPDVVETLRRAYDDWWTSLEPSFERFVRVRLGSDAEPVTRLSAHDWHVEDQAHSPWDQSHVRRGLLGKGFWAVEVERPGRYELVLRRWPDGVEGTLEATRARVAIGGKEISKDVDVDASAARFELDLAPGPARLETWLTLPDGRERGAYFVSIRRLGASR